MSPEKKIALKHPYAVVEYYRNPKAGVTYFENKGRGLVAMTPIAEGEIIEESPVLRISAEQEAAFDNHDLEHYLFAWNPDDKTEEQVVCFGMLALANHSRKANCGIECDYTKECIVLYALEDIPAGAELVFDYGCQLWFDSVE